MKMRYICLFFLLLITSLFPKHTDAEEMVTVRLVNYIGETQNLDIQLIGDYLTFDSTLSLKEGVNYKLTVKNGSLFLEEEGIKHKLNGPLFLIPESYDHNHFIFV